MENLEQATQAVTQAVDDNGAANMNMQAAKQWLEQEKQTWAGKFGEGSGMVGLLAAAEAKAEEAASAVAQAGATLEALQEALETLA